MLLTRVLQITLWCKITLEEQKTGELYDGYFYVKSDNLYRFKANIEDGFRFYINGKIVVDEFTLQKGEIIGAVALKKGFQKIRLEFLEKKGRPRLRFYTKRPKEEDWKTIESTSLYH